MCIERIRKMIRGITYDKQLFKSNDFALMSKRFFNNADGIINGCTLGTSGNTITIATGWFIASGYYTNISSQEVVNASNGTLVYEIDLTKTNTTQQFNQGSFKIIQGTPTQQDLFASGTLYQMPIATISTNGTTASITETLWSNVTRDFQTQIDAINQVQTDTRTYTDSEDSGSLTVTFTRIGKIVYIKADGTINPGQSSAYPYSGFTTDIPEFAKISTTPESGSKIVCCCSYNDYQSVLDPSVGVGIHAGINLVFRKTNNGRYYISSKIERAGAQEQETKITAFGYYISE